MISAILVGLVKELVRLKNTTYIGDGTSTQTGTLKRPKHPSCSSFRRLWARIACSTLVVVLHVPPLCCVLFLGAGLKTGPCIL